MNTFNTANNKLTGLKLKRTDLHLKKNSINHILNRMGYKPINTSERWELIKRRKVILSEIDKLDKDIKRMISVKWNLFP
tara:strand:- start:1497 stop:1733 length:237 start_codon:yes stop_codon:yes gene_type:complete